MICRPCRPRQLCHRWRECDRCCRIRQAKFADRAEAAAAFMVVPGLTVLIPHDGTRKSAERLRQWYAQKIKPNAAVWSIEYGRHSTGYHLNVIAELINDLAPPDARVLTSRIRSTVRATAAYITKRSQTPPADNDVHRNTGYMGKLSTILITKTAAVPILHAAALQTQLTKGDPQITADPTTQAHSTAQPTMQQSREIAARHLHRLLHINERLNGAKRTRLNGRIKSTPTEPNNARPTHICSPPNNAPPPDTAQASFTPLRHLME